MLALLGLGWKGEHRSGEVKKYISGILKAI